jgi:serine protease Do
MQAAAAAVAESVVRIQTVGGLEQLGDVALAAGPTTGLVVSEDGLIVSSAFNFAQRPASILVTLSDGETAPAEIVATDNSRMLVLLRIRTSRPLVAARAVERDAMAVGQWAIAVGRSYPGPTPSISVGVVSALDRITSKVLQTDAKISPVNYGGPLVDIHGRVLGVLVPMSPQGSGPVAGVEWYDSGIGFAVPLADVYRVLPRMAAGSDLHPGVLGVSLARGDSYVLPAVIEVVRPKSPASEAGLAAGDRIVAIGGSAIETQMQMRNAIGRYYAGDTIPIAAVRGEERIEREVTLAERLEPFQHAFFGVLPMRMAADGAGVPVRDVYPDGPAARGGIQAGDRITAIAEAPVTTIEQALAEMNRLEAGTETSVTFEREGASQTIRWTAASLPEEIPSVAPLALPAADRPAAQAQPGAIGDGPMEAGQLEVGQLEVGQFDLNLPDTPDGAVVYVPEGYDANIAHGLVLWCHPGGMLDGGALVGRLKAHCDERNLILVAPRTTQGGDWSPTDLERIRRLLDTIQNTYTIDSRRIVAVGRQSGGAPASVLAIEDRDRVRGLAVVEAALPAATPGQGLVNEPTQRLAFYSAAASGTPLAARIATAAGRLRAEKFPVTTRELGMAPRDLSDEELAELVRWIDTLDRF